MVFSCVIQFEMLAKKSSGSRGSSRSTSDDEENKLEEMVKEKAQSNETAG